MRIILVITTDRWTGTVTDVEAFPILDEQMSTEIATDAEDYFAEMVDLPQDEFEEAIEDGYYQSESQTTSIIWTTVESVQI